MNINSEIKADALNQSVRVSLANGGEESSEGIVERAEAFYAFLTGE
jgi:hypothetical protein